MELSRPTAQPSLWHSRRLRRYFIFWLLAAALFGVALVRSLGRAAPAPSKPALQTTQSTIEDLQARLGRNPESAVLYAELGLAYLQRVRETGDVLYYGLAETALAEALRRDPNDYYALLGQGTLALARHDFTAALDWGEKARSVNPFSPDPLGILVDARVELGRYPEAVATLQEMVDLRPNLTSYSRVSYLRELHGDTAGAIEAMRQAAAFGLPGQEGTLWTQVQLGNLYFNSGDWDAAEAVYLEALSYDPNYPYAQAGMGRIYAARGEIGRAIAIYLPLVERYPTVEFVVTLGDLYTVNGQPDLAARQYELVEVMQQLNAAAGMNVDMELALFLTDNGRDPAAALALAEEAYRRRPSIHAADVLAWAYYQTGDFEQAWEFSQEALQLGTRDALMHYHAGMIAAALGNDKAAQQHLETALAINPAFSLRYAAQAQSMLQR